MQSQGTLNPLGWPDEIWLFSVVSVRRNIVAC